MIVQRIIQRKRKIENWVRLRAHSNSTFSYLINFVFHFFSSGILSSFTAIIGTVGIAFMSAHSYYGAGFVIVCVAYSVLTVLIGWATNYSKQKNRDAQHLQDALEQLESVLFTWSETKQSVTEKLQDIDVKVDVGLDRKAVDGALSEIAFKKAAFAVCRTLAEFLNRLDSNSRPYVTVYQRFRNKNATYDCCKMIAYSVHNEPASFRTEYPIPFDAYDSDKIIEYHSYIFASGSTEIIVLPNREAVRSKFKPHIDPQNREADICQYIGIPIVPKGVGVAFLLQIDVSTPNLLGNSEAAIREFSKNTIQPFAEFLHMIYEDKKLIDKLLNRNC